MLTSEEQAQKFYTYDSVCHSPYMGNASDWLKQISPSAQPIRSITQNWVVTSHQHGKFYSHSSDMASAAGLCSPFSNSHTPFCSLEQDSDASPRDGLRCHFAGKQKVSSGYPVRKLLASLA